MRDVETRQRTTPTPDLFTPAERTAGQEEHIGGPPIGFWKDAWNRLKKNRPAVISLGIIVFLILMTFLGPLLTPYTPFGQDLNRAFTSPNGQFWFGTDEFGRSMFDRVWEGTKVSLYIAFLATAIDIVFGISYGAISGFYGGRVDNVMQRIIEVIVGIPQLVVLILLMVVFQPGIFSISVSLAIVGWTSAARLIRGQVLQLKEQEFFLAARTLGASNFRLIARHLLPNVIYISVITLMFTVPSAIFYEALLSYIGLGISVPDASLGALMENGADNMRYEPYLLLIPATVLALLLLCFNLLGDGLRDALDP
ncbi:MAG: ABC transporter permease, partial [Rubrobacteraceae bacterium]